MRIRPFVCVGVIIIFCIHFVYTKYNYHCVFGHNLVLSSFKIRQCCLFFYQIFSWIVDKQYFELLPVFGLSEKYVKLYDCFSQLYKFTDLLINYRLLIYCEIYNRIIVLLFSLVFTVALDVVLL